MEILLAKQFRKAASTLNLLPGCPMIGDHFRVTEGYPDNVPDGRYIMNGC